MTDEQRIRDNARPPDTTARSADPWERLFGKTEETPGAEKSARQSPPKGFVALIELHFVYRRLMELPNEIREAQQRVIEAETKANTWKAIDLPLAAQALDEVVAASTMAAMANGSIDGKNQSARDVQLADWLAEDADVSDARDVLTMVKRRLVELEIAAENARADLARLTNEFHATRASARLQAACLEALAGLAE